MKTKKDRKHDKWDSQDKTIFILTIIITLIWTIGVSWGWF